MDERKRSAATYPMPGLLWRVIVLAVCFVLAVVTHTGLTAVMAPIGADMAVDQGNGGLAEYAKVRAFTLFDWAMAPFWAFTVVTLGFAVQYGHALWVRHKFLNPG